MAVNGSCVLCVQGCLTVGKQILKQIAGYFIVVGFLFAAFVVSYTRLSGADPENELGGGQLRGPGTEPR